MVDDRINAIIDANKFELYDSNVILRRTLREIDDLAARFDTFGDPGRTRTFIGDLRHLIAQTEEQTR